MLAYDIAICLNAWCFESDHSYNVTKGRALLQGYSKMRALSDAEKFALPLLCRGAALRFLLTRLVGLAGSAARCAGASRRIRSNIIASCDFTRPSSIIAITDSRSSFGRSRHHSYRRRLFGKSRARRVGRDPAMGRAHARTQGRREPHHQQPHGIDGCDRGARNSQACLPRSICTPTVNICVNGITSWIHNWKRNGWRTSDKKPVKNADLWQRLDTALGHHDIHWHWVKGHAGHDLNERADQLAREGLTEARAAERA